MNEVGKDFIFCDKPYMPSAGLHNLWTTLYNVVLTLCVCRDIPASTLVLDLHAHTQWYCLLLLEQRDGGVHVLKYILIIPSELLTDYPSPWIYPLDMNQMV